ARAAECVKRGPLCRDREADERVALAALKAAIAAPVPAAATIAAADPQVTAAVRLAPWAGLSISAAGIVNLRFVLMGMLPNVGGFVLALGGGLAQRVRLLRC